jgi:hypothetical protein
MRKHLILLCFLSTTFNNLFAYEIWYHPNECWHIKNSDTTNTKSKDAFQFVDFIGQYGLPFRFNIKKEENEVWSDWKAINQMSTPMNFAGHATQTFIDRNKEIFMKHPEYLAEKGGTRPGYGKAGKLCISNENVRKLYIQDAISWFNNIKNVNSSYSVEPTDGANQCECSKCKKIGSISNRVFFLSNEIANEVNKIHPNAKINLYAYYQHSVPPPFILNKNLHIIVVPSGFQNHFSPEYMMYAWKDKTENKYIREYLGIPQRTLDLPKVNVENYVWRIQLAHKFKYKGFINETGSSINNSIIMTLCNELYKNPNLTWKDVFDDFINNCFPNCKDPMRRMFTRWYTQWNKDNETKYTLFDIQEASQMSNLTILEKERLLNLKAYSHYIALFSEWDKNRKDTVASNTYFSYIQNSSNYLIVNAGALYRLIMCGKEANPKDKEKFNPKTYKYKYLTPEQIELNFKKDLKKYLTDKLPPKVPIYFSWDEVYSKLTPNMFLDQHQLKLGRNADFQFRVIDNIKFTAKNISKQKGVDTLDHISLYIYDKLFEEVFKLTIKEGETKKLMLKANKTYYCNFKEAYSTTLEINGKSIIAFENAMNKKVKTKDTLYYYDNKWLKNVTQSNVYNPKLFILKLPQ